MRSLLIVILFILYFVLFLPVLIVLFIIRHFNKPLSEEITFRIAKVLLSLGLFLSGVKVNVKGRENIPTDREAVLYVGNHRSYYDILVTYVQFNHPTGYVAKKGIGLIPVMGQWLILIGCLYLDRTDIKKGLKTILSAIDNIKRGLSMFIFPEGTRNRGTDKDEPGEFKEGSLKIAAKSGCKVIPVAIKDTEKVYENHRPFVRSATVTVTFCKPFRVVELPDEYKKKPALYVRNIIRDELKRD